MWWIEVRVSVECFHWWTVTLCFFWLLGPVLTCVACGKCVNSVCPYCVASPYFPCSQRRHLVTKGPTLKSPATMDPSDSQDWRTGVEQTLARHEEQLKDIAAGVTQILQRLSLSPSPPPGLDPQSELQPQPTVVTPPPDQEPYISPPERYSGKPGHCRAFLTQCSLQFQLQPSFFSSEQARVAYTISLLSGKARLWGAAQWERQTEACSSFKKLSEELQRVFDPIRSADEHSYQLLSLTQGCRPVMEYAIEFRTIATDCGWNDSALLHVFYRGLSERMKDALASRVLPETLDKLVDMSIQIDQRIKEHRQERGQIGRHRRASFTQHQLTQAGAKPQSPKPCPRPVWTHGAGQNSHSLFRHQQDLPLFSSWTSLNMLN